MELNVFSLVCQKKLAEQADCGKIFDDGGRGEAENEAALKGEALHEQKVGSWSACVGWATPPRPLTGAVPLLPHAGALSCSVTRLARFAPP